MFLNLRIFTHLQFIVTNFFFFLVVHITCCQCFKSCEAKQQYCMGEKILDRVKPTSPVSSLSGHICNISWQLFPTPKTKSQLLEWGNHQISKTAWQNWTFKSAKSDLKWPINGLFCSNIVKKPYMSILWHFELHFFPIHNNSSVPSKVLV